MRCKCTFAILCAAAILGGAASAADTPVSSTGDGMLVIGAKLYNMNNAGVVDYSQYPLSTLSVKNLDSGRAYNIELDSNHGMTALPAGTYCLNSVRPQNSSPLVYCAKPFFRVNAGKILVAGYFDFAVNLSGHSYKLVNSFHNPQGLFDALSQADKDTLASFSNNGASGSDGTNPSQ